MYQNISNFSGKVDTAFLFIAGVSVFLLALITFLMIFFVIKYNRKKNLAPSNIKDNLPLEITWTLIPTILVIIMFYYGWTGFKIMRNPPKDAMIVKVTAQMWTWNFEYENGKKSDIMYLPAGKPVKAEIKSLDVVHSFYLPAFKVKEDAVPGMTTYLWFIPNKPGEYDIFCAEYCGQRHSYMLSKAVVVTESEFKNWYEEKKDITAGTSKKLSGAELVKSKGCTGCHSIDGSQSAGPTFKGIYGRKTIIISNGKEKEIITDEKYLRKSLLEPSADIVKGFQPIMPSQKGILTDAEINEIINYLKHLK